MRELGKVGKPNTVLIYRRHGAAEETLGAPYSALGSLVERIGVDHRLARELWTTRNDALIAIGGTMVALREQALLAAREIGPVEVDHGMTGCRTPDASEYITKMAVTGARMSGDAPLGKKDSASDGGDTPKRRRSASCPKRERAR